jgi:hypothetical protein
MEAAGIAEPPSVWITVDKSPLYSQTGIAQSVGAWSVVIQDGHRADQYPEGVDLSEL